MMKQNPTLCKPATGGRYWERPWPPLAAVGTSWYLHTSGALDEGAANGTGVVGTSPDAGVVHEDAHEERRSTMSTFTQG